jgi:hypothetical protein
VESDKGTLKNWRFVLHGSYTNMSININIENIEDAFAFFSFLKQHNLPFHVPANSVEKLITILQNHNLTPYKDILKGGPLEKLCIDRKFDTQLLEATSAFKHFCGREWIINGKYITEQVFTDCIHKYATIHNLHGGFYTRLDSVLQEALKTTKPVVNDYELSQLFQNAVNSALKPVSVVQEFPDDPPVTYFS